MVNVLVKAALKIAVDLVHEGLINKYEAMTRVEPDQISQLLHPNFTPAALAAAEVLIGRITCFTRCWCW